MPQSDVKDEKGNFSPWNAKELGECRSFQVTFLSSYLNTGISRGMKNGWEIYELIFVVIVKHSLPLRSVTLSNEVGVYRNLPFQMLYIQMCCCRPQMNWHYPLSHNDFPTNLQEKSSTHSQTINQHPFESIKFYFSSRHFPLKYETHIALDSRD
jgi:hypothetical protein